MRISASIPLLSLVANPFSAHPRGAVVPSARFDEWDLERGTEGRFDGGCITFASIGAPSVTVSPARRDSEERSPPITASGELRDVCSRAADLVAAGRARGGSAAIFVGQELRGTELTSDNAFIIPLRAAAAGLAFAFEALSPSAAVYAAERLIGLGSGLTPAGDDFLCGFLAARRSLAARHGTGRHFLDEFGRLLGDVLRRTNDISGAFLSSAASGRFSCALLAFADAIRAEVSAFAASGGLAAQIDEGEGALAEAVATLCTIGHSSGLDAAEGFLYGLGTGGANRYGDQN